MPLPDHPNIRPWALGLRRSQGYQIGRLPVQGDGPDLIHHAVGNVFERSAYMPIRPQTNRPERSDQTDRPDRPDHPDHPDRPDSASRYSDSDQDSEDRAKRRRLTTPMSTHRKHCHRYGQFGQHETGDLKMYVINYSEIPECPTTDSALQVDNVVLDNDSVFFIAGESCSILLEHDTSVPCIVEEVVIETPRREAHFPVQEGLVFVGTDPLELMQSASWYTLSHNNEIDGGGQSRLHQARLNVEYENWVQTRGMIGAIIGGDPFGRPADKPVESSRQIEPPKSDRASPAVRSPSPALGRTATGSGPAEQAGGDISSDAESEPEVWVTRPPRLRGRRGRPRIEARTPDQFDYHNLPAHMPAPIPVEAVIHCDENEMFHYPQDGAPFRSTEFEDETEYQDDDTFEDDEADAEAAEEEGLESRSPRWARALREAFAAYHRVQRAAGIMQGGAQKVCVKSQLMMSAQPDYPPPIAPVAMFFIPRRKSRAIIRLTPPMAAKYVLVKLFSPRPRGVMTVSRIAVRGRAGPQFFAASAVR